MRMEKRSSMLEGLKLEDKPLWLLAAASIASLVFYLFPNMLPADWRPYRKKGSKVSAKLAVSDAAGSKQLVKFVLHSNEF